MAPTETVEIARAAPADVPTLGEALARAFQDDPVFRWVVPDAEDRRARLPSVFAAFAEVYLIHDEAYVAGDGVGAALWAPPGVEPIPGEEAEAFGERLGEILGEDAERGQEIQALLEEHHPEEPCWYLQFMGVVPEHQGRGIGGRLLKAVLRGCDESGTPAYLEATSRDNRRLYERHGFETVGEIAVPQGPSLWPMWREPLTA